MALDPTEIDIITAALDARDAQKAFVLPGKVQAVDASAGTVDVLPMVRQPVDVDDGSVATRDYPIIPAVPIVWSQTASFAITFPIAAGDFGLLLVMTHGVSSFLDTGQVSDPGDVAHSHVSNAVFLPGFGPKSSKPTTVGNGAVCVNSGSAEIHLGDVAANFVALSNLVTTELNKMWTALSTATYTPGPGAAIPLTFVSPYVGASVAATKVKAQ